MKHIICRCCSRATPARSPRGGPVLGRGYTIVHCVLNRRRRPEDASLSRMTIVTTGSDEVIEQITKHLNRLIEVVKVVDLTEGSYTERELG